MEILALFTSIRSTLLSLSRSVQRGCDTERAARLIDSNTLTSNDGKSQCSFESLTASIRSPNVRAIADHWFTAKGSQLMLSWKQLQPARIKKQLPLIWALRYDPLTGQFIGRLAGQEIHRIIGKSIAGLSLCEIFPSEAVPSFSELLTRVVEGPRIYHCIGRIYELVGRYGPGERLVMPLATDGVTADGVLGISQYYYPHARVDGDSPKLEEWFSIHPPRR